MNYQEPGEPSIHSFIVRIWLETPEQENMPPTWYGQITPIEGKEQHYFKTLNEMCRIVGLYLQSLNIDPGPGWQLNFKFNQVKRNVKRFLGKIHVAVG